MRLFLRGLLFLLLVTAWVVLPGTALGDRVGRLVKILKSNSDYRVKLQVVLALGKLGDPKAVPALIGTLSDENKTVRGIAASSLARIGNEKALPVLQKLLAREKDPFVRSQFEEAIKSLKMRKEGPPPGTRLYLTVGKVSDSSGKAGRQLVDAMGQALLKELASVDGVVTDWGGRRPTAKDLSKRRIKGFILDGAILSLGYKNTGSEVEISCSIRVSLATFPGNSMKAFYSGGASMMVSARGFQPEQAANYYKDVVEGAAQGAKEHLVQSYLAQQ